jgi:hypothetical protein
MSYAIDWTLRDASGRTVATLLHYPRTPTTRWWPDEAIDETSILRIAPDLAEGQYSLHARMFLPEQTAQTIELAMTGKQPDGSYRLATITAARPAEPSPARINFDFSKPVTGWWFAKGMTASHSQEGHNQPGSLKLVGQQPGESWGYASFGMGQALTPAARYRASCWMKVPDWSSPTLPPYIKFGFNDASGKWMTNVSSNKYDLQKAGEWQQLTMDFDVPPDTGSTQFEIERGEFLPPAGGTILLDDLSLELLESP